MDAITRSVETAINMAEEEKIENKDVLRYASPNKICYEVTKGKISPWMLYQSKSGVEFRSKLDDTQQKMVLDYIDPERWAIKFKRDPEAVKEVKTLLKQAGF